MRNKLYIFLSVFVLVLFFGSCDEVNTLQTEQSYNYGYFPVDSGSWYEYQVQYITVDADLNINDTSNYYLREVYTHEFIDASGDTMRIIQRYYKDSLQKAWQNYQTWYAGINGDEALKVEENIKYVKQKFPLKLGFIWNGNAYNRIDTLGEFQYEVMQIDMPEIVNNLSFDSVLVVTQRNFASLVQKYSFFEKYAYGVGLIEKQQIDIYSDDVDADIPIEDRVTKGTIFKMHIINYGKVY